MPKRERQRRRAVRRGYAAALRHVIRLTAEAQRRYVALHTSDMVEIIRADLADIQEGRA
jgi:hypothetical protein